jgi:diacylglycerol O-acyltransferase
MADVDDLVRRFPVELAALKAAVVTAQAPSSLKRARTKKAASGR